MAESILMTALSPTMQDGGTAANVIPDECSFVINRRLIPVENKEQVCNLAGMRKSRIKSSGHFFDLFTGFGIDGNEQNAYAGCY